MPTSAYSVSYNFDNIQILGTLILLNVLFRLQCINSSESNFTYIIDEELRPPYTLGNLVNDLKLRHRIDGLHPKLYFLPSNQIGAQYLHIDFQTSTYQYLKLTKKMDRDSLCSTTKAHTRGNINACVCETTPPYSCYFFMVLALNKAGRIKYTFVVQIIINDVNDHQPKFNTPIVKITVSEDAAINSRYPLPTAVDLDWGFNAKLEYSLEDNFNFRLDHTTTKLTNLLHLRLVVQLDRETRDNYKLKVTVHDLSRDKRLSSTLTVYITVADVNDCAPVISHKISEPVLINESVRQLPKLLGQIFAVDCDSDMNSQISFSILDKTQAQIYGIFRVDQRTGLLSLVSPPDREIMAFYNLIIIAHDNGHVKQSASITLKINILDDNDNAPFIDGPSQPEVTENNQYPIVIAKYKVFDADLQSNITCGLIQPHPSFSLKISGSRLRSSKAAEYELIALSVFDREFLPHYNITIVCSDSRMTSTLPISVVVLDINDNAPVFIAPRENSRIISISESYKPSRNGEAILTVKANDSDANINRQLEYFIVPTPQPLQQQPVFTIHLLSGKLFLMRGLDYEKGHFCQVVIGARDGGQPSLTTSITLTFSITDSNDNVPQYNGPLILQVKENSPAGSVLGVLNITDPDTGPGGQIQTSLEYPRQVFSLFDNQLVVSRVLDREKHDRYNLKLLLVDRGRPPLSSSVTLTVMVTDENDHSPTWVKPSKYINHTFVYSDYSLRGKRVLRIIGTDKDTGINSELSYFIVSQPAKQLFKIDEKSGWLLVATEGITYHDIGNYSMIIKISDCGNIPREIDTPFSLYIVDDPPFDWLSYVTYQSVIYALLLIFVTIVLGVFIGIIYKYRQNCTQRGPDHRLPIGSLNKKQITNIYPSNQSSHNNAGYYNNTIGVAFNQSNPIPTQNQSSSSYTNIDFSAANQPELYPKKTYNFFDDDCVGENCVESFEMVVGANTTGNKMMMIPQQDLDILPSPYKSHAHQIQYSKSLTPTISPLLMSDPLNSNKCMQINAIQVCNRSNSDSGHGESAESRLLINESLPNIEVIPRDDDKFSPTKPDIQSKLTYTIDWCKSPKIQPITEYNQLTSSNQNPSSLTLPQSSSLSGVCVYNNLSSKNNKFHTNPPPQIHSNKTITSNIKYVLDEQDDDDDDDDDEDYH